MRFTELGSDMRESAVALRANVADYVDRRLEQASTGSSVWFAALDEADQIVGWVVLNWSADGTGANVEDLWVREDRRRQGVGVALMNEAERRSEDRHEASLWLAVNPTNEPAARLYERLGFSHDGGEPYLDGVYDGVEDWVIDMRKPFEPSA